MNRIDLSDRVLLRLVAAAVLVLTVYFALLPALPQAFRLPGSAPLHIAGVIGSSLLLVSVAFVAAKRSGRGGPPPAWFVAHAVCAVAGFALVAAHSAGRLRHAPALLLLALVALAALGVWARVRLSRRLAATFATRRALLDPPAPQARGSLAALIAEKEALLRRLDPGAREATFSPTLGHWLRAPALAYRYARLARAEAGVIGTRQAAGLALGYWRAVHIALAWLFVAGLVVHIVTVTFFAGYVAGGGEVYWWHLAAW
ncbi:MAG: hypothetical protein HY521_04185 [Proteobacteria bacterium]|nr:hypothetical protein [Pseudomonadota bacterium]